MPDPTYTFGQNAGNAVNPGDDTGQILTQIAANTQDSADDGGGSNDPVSTTPKQFTQVTNSDPGTTDAKVFTLAAGEKGFIQNLDDAALYVRYGAAASALHFSYVLKAGSAADDGLGGLVVIDDWVGDVYVAAAAGTARYIAWKMN